MLLFPVNDKTFEITFTVDLYMGKALADTYEHKVYATTTLEMGKAYNFKAVLDGSNVTGNEDALKPIEFVVEVEEWVPAGNENNETEILPAAITTEAEFAAALNYGGNFKLDADITLSTTLNITKDVVLDLNGKILTNKVENTATDVLVVAEGATLTINGEGTVEAVTGNDGYAIIVDGKLIINDGTFKSGVDAEGAPNAVIYARQSGEVYVNGGYFPNDNASKYVLNKRDADNATATINVTAGRFGAFNPADNAAENPKQNWMDENSFVVAEGTEFVVRPFADASGIKFAGEFNGNGETIAVENPESNFVFNPSASADIKNVTIDGANKLFEGEYGMRALYFTAGGTYNIDNVKVYNVTYALNVNTTEAVTLNVTNSTLEGWTSFGASTTAKFTNVSFENGKYANFKPYTSTTLENCTFEAGFALDFSSLNGVMTLKNCTCNGVVITAENIETVGIKLDTYDASKVAF
jgi:hypothetical protein